MKLHEARVILTGASGGIGRQLALKLASRGARLALAGLRADELIPVQDTITQNGGMAISIEADITRAEDRQNLINQTNRQLGGVDLLINSAGISDFCAFDQTDPALIERLYQINVIAPVQLTRALLPQLLDQGYGRIVNMGSVFGSLGFAYFAAYSSSKFALRGFSQALRRELDGTGVGVTYVAPRAVKTAINSAAVYRMAEAVKMKMDEPETVASWVVRMIEKERSEATFGFAENFFVKLNALLPRLVDRGLGKQNRVMREFATPSRH
jgi:short-subunit dehydrogenase